MTAFRIKRSPIYRIEPTIDGIGRLPRISTGTRDKRIAEQMEAMLDQLAKSGHSDLVVQLRDGHVKLAELWHAHMKRDRDSELQRLKARKAAVTDARTKTGYEQLLELAPADARLSWLTEPANISDMYARARKGRAANSVRRSLHRAVSDLLTRRFTRGRMLAIMADVEVPGQYDERKIMLSRDEIAKVLDACDPVFRNAVGFALTSGVDQGPMLLMEPRDFDESTRILHVRDEKTAFRNRRIQIDVEAARYFMLAAAGKEPGDRVFPWTRWQVRRYWDTAKKKIGRPDVRWKDLRGIFATYFLEAGGNIRELQFILGHSTPAMTLRYVRRVATKSGAGVGKAMGLDRRRLRVEKGA